MPKGQCTRDTVYQRRTDDTKHWEETVRTLDAKYEAESLCKLVLQSPSNNGSLDEQLSDNP